MILALLTAVQLYIWHQLQPRFEIAALEVVNELKVAAGSFVGNKIGSATEAAATLTRVESSLCPMVNKQQVRLCHSKCCTYTQLSTFLIMLDRRKVFQGLQVGQAQLIVLMLGSDQGTVHWDGCSSQHSDQAACFVLDSDTTAYSRCTWCSVPCL